MWVGGFLMMSSLATYFSFSIKKMDSRVVSTLLIASLPIITFGILATQSRGALMGLVAGAIAFFIFAGREFIWVQRKMIIAAAILFSLIISISFMKGSNPVQRILDEMKTSSESSGQKVQAEGNAGSRIETWTSAIGIVSDRPFFGVGPEVIKNWFPLYETELFRFKETFHVKQDRCHNEVLDLATTKGILGLLIYFWLMIEVFRFGIESRKKNPTEGIIIAGSFAGIVSYIFQNQFSFGVVAITSLFWIFMAVVVSASKPEEEKTFTAVEGFTPKWRLIVLLWIAITLLVIPTPEVLGLRSGLSAFPYIADKHFKTAKIYSESNMVPQAIEEYKQSLKFQPYEEGTWINLGLAYLNNRNNSKDPGQDISNAIEAFRRGTRVNPYNSDFYHLSGAAYMMASADPAMVVTAEALFQKALVTDHYRAEAYQELGNIFIRRGNVKEGIAYFEKSFHSLPNNFELGKVLLNYYMSINKPEKALAIFERSHSLWPESNELAIFLGNAYSNLGQDKKATDFFKGLISRDPNNASAISGLAILDIKLGKLPEAFALLQNALIIDPTNINLHNGLGTYYLKTGDKIRAKQSFEIVLRQDSKNEYANTFIKALR